MPTATLEDVAYSSAAEIEQLVDAFESLELPRAQWTTHEAHLMVALWYLPPGPGVHARMNG